MPDVKFFPACQARCVQFPSTAANTIFVVFVRILRACTLTRVGLRYVQRSKRDHEKLPKKLLTPGICWFAARGQLAVCIRNNGIVFVGVDARRRRTCVADHPGGLAAYGRKSRSMNYEWRSSRFCLVRRTYDAPPWGVCAGKLTKS